MLRIKFISFAFIDFISEPEAMYISMNSQFKECPLKCCHTLSSANQGPILGCTHSGSPRYRYFLFYFTLQTANARMF